jgi:two-component system nitrogen regulation sensor histidine kinase GlnL
MAVELFPSALSHFDPTDLFDALATGIIVLDAQLCPIYANVAAQDLLAFSLNKARGRPFGDFLHEPNGLIANLRRVLQTGEGIADRELTLRPIGAPQAARVLDITITALEGQITGTHLLLELADDTQRHKISRDNDMMARLDSSRLMVRQLAHEIKNPLGGAAGARAPGCNTEGIYRRHHQRSGPAHGPRRFDGRSEPRAGEA